MKAGLFYQGNLAVNREWLVELLKWETVEYCSYFMTNISKRHCQC